MKARKSKATVKKTVKKAVSKTPKPKIKKTKQGMDFFEQSVVLAAFINHKRESDPAFQALPRYELHSPLLEPLREHLSQYAFTQTEIAKALQDLVKSKAFKAVYPHKKEMKQSLTLANTESKALLLELLQLAGPEAYKVIYLTGKDRHDIQKTTLVKHALQLGKIDVRPEHAEAHEWQGQSASAPQIRHTSFKQHGGDFVNRFQVASHRRGRG